MYAFCEYTFIQQGREKREKKRQTKKRDEIKRKQKGKNSDEKRPEVVVHL